ncbi:MAG: NAD-glutamate dehydrogenase [Planctomycetes bacterium]|nr:NAD-glutamate dehydrogenase [Planctomycetota bacterium]
MRSSETPAVTSAPPTTPLINELSQQFKATAESVVPWFLSQMPPMYFQDTTPDRVQNHLRAIIAAKASKAPLDLTIRSDDGKEWTMIRPGNRVGVLSEIVAQLPMNEPLRAATIHATLDGSLVVDTFELGERVPFNPRDPAQAAKVDSVIKWASEHGLDWSEKDIRSYVAGASADYVLTLTPLRLSRHAALFREVSGTDGARTELEQEADPTQSRISIAFSNARTRTMLERTAMVLARAKISIFRAYLDQVKDAPHGQVTLLAFVVQTEDGKQIDPKSDIWKKVSHDIARVKWINYDILELANRHPGLDLNRAEAVMGLCHLVHQMLVHQDRLAFQSQVILEAAEESMDISLRIVDLLAARFDPTKPMDDAAFASAVKVIQTSLEFLRPPGWNTVLMGMLRAVQATLRTNYHLPQRFGFALRLKPELLQDELRPNLPFGVFFVSGRGFNGFHVRFKEIARGGLRLVRPRDAAQHARESDRLYDEVYALASAQQQKNKDIPEGGAKCALLLEPPSDPTRCVKSFVDCMLDLITPEPGTRAKVIDKLGIEEFIYLGPDENITPDHIEWIVERAKRRKYPLPTAFMSSKPNAGINHKVYGVTSEGVNVFLEVALRDRGIDPKKQPFTVKITGGPDGDVAGNMISILKRDYGTNPRITGIADGSGSGEDPDGLDIDELLRLFAEAKPIASFNKKKLGKNGRIVTVDEPDGVRLRNTLHNRLATDAFIPGGGRPSTIDERNWKEYLKPDGTPSSPLIVEGANLFLTAEARKHLSAAGTTIIKDSSANKCGVICSSYEIIACMLLSEAEFLRIKTPFVEGVLAKLREMARTEAELLLREGKARKDKSLPEISVSISKAMNDAADLIHGSMASWSAADHALARGLVLEHLPQVLLETVGARVFKDLPAPYLKWMIAKKLASTMIYSSGIDYLAGSTPEQAAAKALEFMRQSKKIQAQAELAKSLK